jgi:enamine deaminase RidA (YjgF/YER057c/UK114 family)
VVAGNLGFFVEVPDNPESSPNDQFRSILDQVEARCKVIGSSLENLVQVVVYLPYPEDLALFNELWDEWVPGGCAPSRALSHTTLVDPRFRVELIVTAWISENPGSPGCSE